MKIHTLQNELESVLRQKGLVYGVYPDIHNLLAFLEKAKDKKQTLRLMYGETYDAFGITIDSLKYYLFLSQLHRFLENRGYSVESTILIADVASVLNKSVQNKEELLQAGIQRVSQIQKIVEIFGLKIKPVLMSELFQNSRLQENIKKVSAYTQISKPVQRFFEKTVLQNKVSQERQTGFRYAVEGVATALQFDIKIGPPREQYYDKAAKIIAKDLQLQPLHSIYLKPTYPLGKDFSFFISHAEIEELGLTPYKAGSNKLQDFRIILGKTSLLTIKELINVSFLSEDIHLANPVVDLFFTTELGEYSLKNGHSLLFRFDTSLVKDDYNFRKLVFERIKKYILNPLEEGGFYEIK